MSQAYARSNVLKPNKGFGHFKKMTKKESKDCRFLSLYYYRSYNITKTRICVPKQSHLVR